MNILIKDVLVLPMMASGREETLFRGCVGISDNRIVMVGHDDQEADRFRREHAGSLCEIDGRGKLLMPGFINIHNHVAMTLMRSYADDMPLMPWLTEKIWPFEAKEQPDDVRLGAELGIAEMLLGGTTTFVDMYWMQSSVAEAVCRSGIRAVLSPCFVDNRFEEFERDLMTVMDTYVGNCDGRIGVMIAPHAPYTCSSEHLSRALELSRRYDIGINIHVAETESEIETIAQRYGKSPVVYLRDLGIFERPAIAVHTVYLNDEDVAILKQYGVSVAHNPQSNMKISSGIAPVARLLREGINVGIGTDGPCSNNDLDMWEEMRSASFLQKVATGDPCVLPAYEVLKMATVNGAKAIGMEGQLGEIAEGRLADVILIDICKPHLCPQHDLIANLVYCGKSSDVDTVIVNGRVVVEQGQLLTLDTKTLCRDIQTRVEEMLRRH